MHYYETKIYLFFRRFYFRYIGIPNAYRISSKLNILNSKDSIQYILEHHCSVSRFGDGEFSVIWGGGNEFQDPNQRLAKMLSEVLNSRLANHMVGIPYHIKDVSNHIDPGNFWAPFTAINIKRLMNILSKNRLYLNASMTRFYRENKNKSQCPELIAMLKQLWAGRDIVIVEGCLTRSGVGNDLYDNAVSIQRVLGPASNAINKYDEMLSAIKQNVPKDRLVILCYGMAATVLAYDLAKEGYWALDLGHMDIEYEWFRMGANEQRVAIKCKFVNEVPEGHIVETCDDPIYQSQILVDITK